MQLIEERDQIERCDLLKINSVWWAGLLVGGGETPAPSRKADPGLLLCGQRHCCVGERERRWKEAFVNLWRSRKRKREKREKMKKKQ
jgi:hypothetical protein